MYALLRAAAGIALRWYYGDVRIDGVERIPRGRPLLLVVNHPNALVDALLVARAVPWRVLILAKATLFRNRVAGALLRLLGVLPVRRASDERASGRVDPTRNRDTFLAVRESLRRGQTVLIFPEGKSHDEPSLAPLKSGAARIALDARAAGVERLVLVPIGLTFERKELPRTRVLVAVGEPISMDDWRPRTESDRPAEALTREIDARLRAVTLNYASADDAARIIRLASTIAALLGETRATMTARGLDVDAAIARRISELSARLASSDPMRAPADELMARLAAVERTASMHGVSIEDAGVPVDLWAVARLIARQSWQLLLGAPLAAWGRVNHWVPFRAARALALKTSKDGSDPAMHTVVAGAAFVLIAYTVQTALVAAVWGILPAGVYLVSLPIAADVDLWFSDRLSRVMRRARALHLFSRNPALHRSILNELAELRSAVTALDRQLGSGSPALNA